MMVRFTVPDIYAVWSKSADTRFCSTSGGAFTEFAKAIIADGGCVAGAKYNNENLVEHDLIDNLEDIEKLRQSKYMSSSMGDIYKRVKAELASGRLVGFCGSPCQVAGLYSFLGKEYDNLFTMDFICRGMNSPKAFKAWMNEIEHQEGSKVTKVWFKYKEGGWKTSPRRTRLDFENGSHRVYEDEDIPIFNIFPIQPHHFLKVRNITSPTNLPQPSNPWFYRQSCPVMQFIEICFRYQWWPGS